ncbi:hypothetical protein CsSME_00050938 [Camellia sinensis var. sinensis]
MKANKTRGLSKYFQGKSQTFGSLASVKSLEDLAKKGKRPYRRKVKSFLRLPYQRRLLGFLFYLH